MAATPPVPSFAPGILPTSLISAITTWMTFMATPAEAVLRQAVVQSIPTGGGGTALTFDTSDLDTVGGHSNVTNNSRYTAVYAGWYWCGGAYGAAASAAGQRSANWSVNGTIINAGGTSINSTAAGGIIVPAVMQLIFLNVGDYVELKAFQNSGGALNTTNGAGTQSVMSIWRASN